MEDMSLLENQLHHNTVSKDELKTRIAQVLCLVKRFLDLSFHEAVVKRFQEEEDLTVTEDDAI